VAGPWPGLKIGRASDGGHDTDHGKIIMIYFIRSNNNMINIDRSSRTRRILYTLRKYSSDRDEKFDLIGEIEGSEADLAEIRGLFEDLHSHKGWYWSDERLTQFIDRFCSKKQ